MEEWIHMTTEVIEEPKERESLVLKSDGSPYKLKRSTTIGFDLRPKGQIDAHRN